MSEWRKAHRDPRLDAESVNNKLLQIGFCVLWIFSGVELLWQSIPIISGINPTRSDAIKVLVYFVVSFIAWGALYYLVAKEKKDDAKNNPSS